MNSVECNGGNQSNVACHRENYNLGRQCGYGWQWCPPVQHGAPNTAKEWTPRLILGKRPTYRTVGGGKPNSSCDTIPADIGTDELDVRTHCMNFSKSMSERCPDNETKHYVHLKFRHIQMNILFKMGSKDALKNVKFSVVQQFRIQGSNNGIAMGTVCGADA